MSEPPQPPEPAMTAIAGPWGSPVYSHRSAQIRCNKGGHVCAPFIEGHTLHGHSLGVLGTITPLVDLRLGEGWLPGHMRAISNAVE